MTSLNAVNDVLTSLPLIVLTYDANTKTLGAHPVFTIAFEMRSPVLTEVCSPYAQLFPWQHTFYVSLNFIRTVGAFDCITC